MARPDRSGRLSVRPLLAAMGWPPGHRLDITAVDGLLLVTSSAGGGQVVSPRGDLVVPAPARSWCGIAGGSLVVLAGYPAAGLVVIHPEHLVAVLLHDLDAHLPGGDRDR
jgi:hypothetical protein